VADEPQRPLGSIDEALRSSGRPPSAGQSGRATLIERLSALALEGPGGDGLASNEPFSTEARAMQGHVVRGRD